MNIKKCAVSYFIISIVFPIAIYLASIYGNNKLKELTSVLFVFYAIIIFYYSIRVIKYVFGNREHEFLDKGFVLRICLAVIIMFLGRYIAVCLLNITEIPTVLIEIVIMPFSFMFIIPFIKNYCINRKTVVVTLIVSILLIYVVMPITFAFIESKAGNNLILLSSVYNKYFVYEEISNRWLLIITELFKLNLSDKVMLVLINASKVSMFCIVFLPYFIINFILIDELTYREMCKDLSKKKIFAVLGILIVGVVVCINMSTQGAIELIYSLKH